MNIAQVCSNQLFDVVNDILDFSKLEENKIIIDRKPLSLNMVVEDSLQVQYSLYILMLMLVHMYIYKDHMYPV